jgi:hypothetical protein
MAYADFTLDTVAAILGITAEPADLFAGIGPVEVPTWLRESLDRGLRQALVSEKARSEFIVVPILLATQELSAAPIAIYSGQRLDVDPSQGLLGECDFVLAAGQPLPALRSPILTVVEAKKNDVESGIGQCLAEMAGARLFNQRAGQSATHMYGCVTTGEVWQFLRLEGNLSQIDRRRYYIDNVSGILAVLVEIVSRAST